MLDDYVQKGLMLHYDAVKNTKNGHDKNSDTWYDLSGNNNNGTLKGGVTWTEDGLYFDGIDDWVSIGEMNYDNITIEVVMMYSDIKNEDEQDIVANWQEGGYGILGNTKNSFCIHTDNYKYVYGSKNTQVGKKYSLSGNYDNHNIVFYENKFKTTQKEEGTIKETTGNTIMILGAEPEHSGARNGFLNGTIYSVRIYNRALTDDEVMQNYKIDKMLYGVEDINE